MAKARRVKFLVAGRGLAGGFLMRHLHHLAFVLLAGLFLGAAAGCEDEGPVEEAAEETEDAVEDAADEIEDAADEVEDELQ